MFKLPELDYSNSERPSFVEKLKYQIVNESGLGYLSKGIMVLAIFVSFYLADLFKWSSWDTAMFVGGYSINGLVELNWVTKNPEAKINKMSGYYMGKATKDTGGIQYLRITEEEYLAHRNSDFL